MAVILTTGLVPEVRAIAVRQSLTMHLHFGEVALPTPDASQVWAVTLRTNVDTVEAPRGSFVSTWVTPNRPEVRTRSTVLDMLERFGSDWNRDYEAERRARLNVPADAVVTDVETFGGIRRRIDWWEVEA